MEVKAWDIVSLVISLMAQATFIFITYNPGGREDRASAKLQTEVA